MRNSADQIAAAKRQFGDRRPSRYGDKFVEYDSPLDPGIARAVEVLNSVNIETYESCHGGEGHCYPEPTVRFHGDYSEGFRALAVALQHKLPVMALRRIWVVTHGEPVGPSWELTFSTMAV